MGAFVSVVRTRYGGQIEVRSQWPDRTMPPSRSSSFSFSGEAVTTDRAVGIPWLGRAIRLVAGLGASLELGVFEGEDADKRPSESFPADLFDRPVEGMSAFDWRYDVFAALEGSENAVLIKVKSKGKVVELQPVPMDLVQIRLDRKTREKVFDIVGAGGQIRTLTTSDALHVRGHSPYGGPVGVSRIWQHRDPAGAMLAAQRFEGAFFRNNARPDIAVIFPQGVTKEQANQWRDEWATEYGGGDNAGRPLPIGGGATIQPIPMSMADAQFLETKKYGVEEGSRIIDVDAEMLGAVVPRPNKAESLDFFLRVQMTPRLRRIELAFRADTDLFPAASPLYPQFEIHDLMFLDAVRRAQVQHEQIQDGTLLPDEARAENGRPPLPDGLGMIPQVTPVGGAPNQKVIPDDQATQNEVDDLAGRSLNGSHALVT